MSSLNVFIKCGWDDPDGSKEKGKTGVLSVRNGHPVAFDEGWLAEEGHTGREVGFRVPVAALRDPAHAGLAAGPAWTSVSLLQLQGRELGTNWAGLRI